ncbi:MAG: hypothetical protein AAGD32_01325 [Planctomycetota bacterium]
MSRLDKHVAAVRTQMLLGDLLKRAAVTLLIAGGALWVYVIAARVFAMRLPGEMFWLIGGAVLALVAAMIWAFVNRPAEHEAAVAIDEKLGLKSKFASALSFRNDSDPFARAAVQDAEQTATGVNLGKEFRPAFPNSAWLALAVLLGMGATAAFLGDFDLFNNPAEDPAVLAQQQQAEVEAKAVVERALQTINAAPPVVMADESVEQAKADLESLLASPTFQPEQARQTASQSLESLQDALAEQVRGNQKFAEAREQQRMLANMPPLEGADGPVGEASDAIKEGDFSKATEAIEQLVDDFQEMTPEKQAEATQQMQQMAQQLQQAANNPQAQQQMQNQLQQMGMNQQQAQQAAQLMQQAAQGNQQAAQQLQQMAQQAMQQMNNGQGPTQQQQQKIQQAMQQMQAQANTQQQAAQMAQAAQQMAQAMQAAQQGQAQQGQQGQQGGQQPGGAQQQANAQQGAQQGMQQGAQQMQQTMQQMQAIQQDMQAVRAAQQAAQQAQAAANQNPNGPQGNGQQGQQQGQQGQGGQGQGQQGGMAQAGGQPGGQGGQQGQGNQGQQGGQGQGQGQGGQWNQPGQGQQGGGGGGPGQGQGGDPGKVAAPFGVKQEFSPSENQEDGQLLASYYVQAEALVGEAKQQLKEVAESAVKNQTDEVDQQRISREAQNAVRNYFNSLTEESDEQ